ncbi:MAG TPA: hypothetical protein VNX86_09075 [Rhizomicrobium sp.]|jgi:hypothetical protein|nr:hypothetical protein [Rhizomicrobium sp.]
MRLLLTTAMCICVAGCVAPKPVQWVAPHTPYIDADYAWSTAPGTAAITGQAFLKTNGGDVKTCAGSDVILIPDGPYAEDVLSTLLAGANVTLDEGFIAKKRAALCDSQGNFKFTALPAGKWLVQTTVTWNVPDVSTGGMDEQGGSLESPVATSKTGTVELLLTDRNLTARKIEF